MNLLRVILVLMYLLPVSIFARAYDGKEHKLSPRESLIDSLYLSKSKELLSEQEASTIIDAYIDDLKEDKKLKKEDLQALSVSYAALNESQKSIQYLEYYIKESHDINILNSNYLNKIKETSEFKNLVDRYQPKVSVWFILYLYGALIGIFIAVLLNIRKDSDKIANLLISLFILLSALFVIHVCLYLSNLQFLFPHTLFYSISFNFLFGPLLYFYLKRITEKYTFKIKDALHLIPALFFVLYFSKYYIMSREEKLHILISHEKMDGRPDDPMLYLVVILKIVSLIVYGILIYKIYKKAKNSEYHIEKVILKWQRDLVMLYGGDVLTHLLYVGMIMRLIPMHITSHIQITSMSLLIIYVGYKVYIQPQLFNRKFIYHELKYQKSGLTERYSIDLKEELLDLLYKDKIYLMNDINLEMLSEKLGTTRHNASQVINEHFNMNFFNLINKFRIEEAQRIFKMNYLNSSLSIIDVAYDVGYNNKVTFNKAFRDYTNLTPTDYINKLKEERTLQKS